MIGSVKTYILYDHRCLRHVNFREIQVVRNNRLPYKCDVRIEILTVKWDFCLGQRLPNLAGQAVQRFGGFHTGPQYLSFTFILSGLSLVFCFPFPIIIALIFNEIRNAAFKKSMQTITYAPHFISTVVVVGMMMAICSPSSGVINKLLAALHLTDEPLYLMGESKYFRFMYIISDIWKDSGWNAIIFVSALAAIDISLYEAAKVDGASSWQQLIYIM